MTQRALASHAVSRGGGEHTMSDQCVVTRAWGTNQSPPPTSQGPGWPVRSLQPTPVAEAAAEPGRASKGAAACWGWG